MKNKTFLLRTLFFCFLLVLFFSSVSADFQTLESLKAKKERIKTIKESVNYLLWFSEEEGSDQNTIRVLEEIGVAAERIEQQVEKKIKDKTKKIVECLEEEGLVIYGFKGCPGCDELTSQFGDYDFLDLIYVECSEEVGRCLDEMENPYVPEVQIKGELYQGVNTFYFLGKATGCVF